MIYDLVLITYDLFVSGHDQFVTPYDQLVLNYDQFVSPYDQLVTVYDQFRPINDQLVTVYDQSMTSLYLVELNDLFMYSPFAYTSTTSGMAMHFLYPTTSRGPEISLLLC